jgi:hypothetical protein
VTRITRKENKCYVPWILILHAYLSFSNVLPKSVHYNRSYQTVDSGRRVGIVWWCCGGRTSLRMSWGADAGYYIMVRYGSFGSTITWSLLRNITAALRCQKHCRLQLQHRVQHKFWRQGGRYKENDAEILKRYYV